MRIEKIVGPRQPVISAARDSGKDRSAKILEFHSESSKSAFEYKNDVLEKIIEDLNKKLINAGRELHRSIHEETGQVMVKVVDTDTGKTIREIPPEKSLDILAKVLEQSGLLVDKIT